MVPDERPVIRPHITVRVRSERLLKLRPRPAPVRGGVRPVPTPAPRPVPRPPTVPPVGAPTAGTVVDAPSPAASGFVPPAATPIAPPPPVPVAAA